MSKFVELAKQFGSSQKRLEEVMQKPRNEIMRDAAIYRFKVSFELAWKTMKAYLEEKGLKDVYLPKDVIRSAFQARIVTNDPKWLDMVDTRNKTSHIYSEAMADQVYGEFADYLPLLRSLAEELG